MSLCAFGAHQTNVEDSAHLIALVLIQCLSVAVVLQGQPHQGAPGAPEELAPPGLPVELQPWRGAAAGQHLK